VGVDLNALFGANVPRYEGFLSETRSSTSTTATLSDFALGSVNTIGTTYDVQPGQYSNTVTATGVDQGTNTWVTATDTSYHFGVSPQAQALTANDAVAPLPPTAAANTAPAVTLPKRTSVALTGGGLAPIPAGTAPGGAAGTQELGIAPTPPPSSVAGIGGPASSTSTGPDEFQPASVTTEVATPTFDPAGGALSFRWSPNPRVPLVNQSSDLPRSAPGPGLVDDAINELDREGIDVNGPGIRPSEEVALGILEGLPSGPSWVSIPTGRKPAARRELVTLGR
jgi:hypothetical protein